MSDGAVTFKHAIVNLIEIESKLQYVASKCAEVISLPMENITLDTSITKLLTCIKFINEL